MGRIKKSLSGIQRRWIVNTLGFSLLLILTALSAFAVAMSNYYYTSMSALLTGRASTYANFISKNYTSGGYDSYYKSLQALAYDFKDRDKFELQFISGYNRLLISTNSAAYPSSGLLIDTPDVRDALGTIATGSWIGADPITGERIMAISAPLTLQGGSVQTVIGVIRCVTSLDRVDTRILQMVGASALVGIIFIAFMVFINLMFIRGILVPMQEINRVSKRIAAGGYGVRIEKEYKDEMGELVQNINHMSSEIRAAERMKSEFISSVSHELRTPLTAINGWGETLLTADMADQNEIRKGIRIMLKETSRLSRMVEELLDFTRIEGGRVTLDIDSFDLASELEEIVYLHMDALKREGITLTYRQPDTVPEISGDRARIKQVFVNILDNAVKHGGSGKRIETELSFDGECFAITVRDFGPGIPESDLPHVKYMFYKGSTSARGSGIGLSVSDEIVRLHGGQLIIESKEGEGTTVTIKFPRKDEMEAPSE